LRIILYQGILLSYNWEVWNFIGNLEQLAVIEKLLQTKIFLISFCNLIQLCFDFFFNFIPILPFHTWDNLLSTYSWLIAIFLLIFISSSSKKIPQIHKWKEKWIIRWRRTEKFSAQFLKKKRRKFFVYKPKLLKIESRKEKFTRLWLKIFVDVWWNEHEIIYITATWTAGNPL